MNELHEMTYGQLTSWYKYWMAEKIAVNLLRDAYDMDAAEMAANREKDIEWDHVKVNRRRDTATEQSKRYGDEILRRAA